MPEESTSKRSKAAFMVLRARKFRGLGEGGVREGGMGFRRLKKEREGERGARRGGEEGRRGGGAEGEGGEVLRVKKELEREGERGFVWLRGGEEG